MKESVSKSIINNKSVLIFLFKEVTIEILFIVKSKQ